MDNLRLPIDASQILDRDPPSSVNFQGFYKWLVYSLDSAQQNAQELIAAQANGESDPGVSWDKDEWDEIGFLRVAKMDFPAPDIQHILDQHFRFIDQMHERALQVEAMDWDVWRYGFVVITRADWREHGVAAINCDKDRGQWKVTKCNNLPMDQMMSLFSVTEVDIGFGELVEQYDGSGNDGPDNQGGPPPIGEWQWLVYYTAPTRLERFHLERTISDKWLDPRGDYTWEEGEECLEYVEGSPPANRLHERWPIDYAERTKATTGRDDEVARVCVLHPSLFVIMHGDASDFEIEIVKMEWDHDINKSDEELMRVGRESKITTQKCEATQLVTKLQWMADEWSVTSGSTESHIA